MNEIEKIKNFTINKNIDTYNEFVNYFFKLSIKEKATIIKTCIDYLKCDNIKNGNLDKIYNMYKILLHKIEYNKLNFKEKSIYELIKRLIIIKGEFKEDKYFNKYCSEYIDEQSNTNHRNTVFLVMQDILNKLNRKYNKDYKIILSDENKIAFVSWTNKSIRRKIVIGQKYVDKLFDCFEDKKSRISLYAYSIFVILHEFKHLLQMEDFYVNDTVYAQKYIKEVFMIDSINEFYNFYHDNFITEKEANEFAFENLFTYLNKYVKCNERNVKKYLKNTFDIYPKDSKTFLLIYKSMIKYIELNKKIKINKVENFYEEIYKLKKEYREN